jgi:hypothetical protein
MADRVERVTQQVSEPANTSATNNTTVREVSEAKASGQTLAARIIWYIAGVIIVLLAFRFVLAMLGANQGNGFVRFIFNASHPLVAPFFGIFSYDDYQYGVSRVELFTLIAMAVYAVIAWGLARLLTLNRAEPRA